MYACVEMRSSEITNLKLVVIPILVLVTQFYS